MENDVHAQDFSENGHAGDRGRRHAGLASTRGPTESKPLIVPRGEAHPRARSKQRRCERLVPGDHERVRTERLRRAAVERAGRRPFRPNFRELLCRARRRGSRESQLRHAVGRVPSGQDAGKLRRGKGPADRRSGMGHPANVTPHGDRLDYHGPERDRPGAVGPARQGRGPARLAVAGRQAPAAERLCQHARLSSPAGRSEESRPDHVRPGLPSAEVVLHEWPCRRSRGFEAEHRAGPRGARGTRSRRDADVRRHPVRVEVGRRGLRNCAGQGDSALPSRTGWRSRCGPTTSTATRD